MLATLDEQQLWTTLGEEATALAGHLGAGGSTRDAFLDLMGQLFARLSNVVAVSRPGLYTGVAVGAAAVRQISDYVAPHMTRDRAFLVTSAVANASSWLCHYWGGDRRASRYERFTVAQGEARRDVWPARHEGLNDIDGIYHPTQEGIVFLSEGQVTDVETGEKGALLGVKTRDQTFFDVVTGLQGYGAV